MGRVARAVQESVETFAYFRACADRDDPHSQNTPAMFPKSTLVAFATLLVALTPVDALWPQPRSLETGSTPLRLAGGFDISFSNSIKKVPDDLRSAVKTAKGYLHKDNLERLVVGRGSADAKTVAKAKTLSKLVLSLESGATANTITSEAQKAPEARDEAYTLTVPEDGSAASISANSTLGLFRGLTTFTQLFYSTGAGTTYLLDAPVSIQDSPAYVRLFYFHNRRGACSPDLFRLLIRSRTAGLCSIQRETCESPRSHLPA